MTPPFEEFYVAYPRKVAKGAARKAWEKMARLEPDLLDKCLTALAWQRLTPSWQERDAAGVLRWVPHPATYLHQECYDDENPAEAQRVREEALRAEERQRVAERERRYEEWESRKRSVS